MTEIFNSDFQQGVKHQQFVRQITSSSGNQKPFLKYLLKRYSSQLFLMTNI